MLCTTTAAPLLRVPRANHTTEGGRPGLPLCATWFILRGTKSAARFAAGVGVIAADAAVDLIVDFAAAADSYRRRAAQHRREGLARAAGLVRGNRPSVVDATAGLGRDAFLLASLGSPVTLVERSPEIHAMLREGLERAGSVPALAPIVARMTLIRGDARDLLGRLTADVVLVDPMHPPRRKSALVKQQMRTTRALVGDDPDALETLECARACARVRVVLKWPARERLLPGWPRPSHFIPGKTVRFDVFMTAPPQTI